RHPQCRSTFFPYTTLFRSDVVRYVPGLQMSQGEGHRDAPVFRGNISTADFFINGVRDDVQYLRDLYNAERIEVLKGPSGMIFGRSEEHTSELQSRENLVCR